MRFCFKTGKAIQAAAALLRNEEAKQMPYLRLLKLLYIADRESLQETGRPITGDHAVAMAQGPVLEGIYQLIKGAHRDTPRWSRVFQTSGYRIKLAEDPGVGELSRYELEKLRAVNERYTYLNEWELVELTHGFEEWIKNHLEASSRPIPVEDILRAVGRENDIPQIEQDEKDRETFDRIFKGC